MSVAVDDASIIGPAVSADVATADGQGAFPGDVLIAVTISDGTHVPLGMTVQDSVNGVSFTADHEEQIGTTGRWVQWSRYVTPVAIPDGSTISFTPYAGSTVQAISVTIIRYATGNLAQGYVSQSNPAGTSQPGPAFSTAPARGSFVMAFAAGLAGAMDVSAPFTSRQIMSGAASLSSATATADGSATFGATWTDTVSEPAVTAVVALESAGVGSPYVVARASAAQGATTLVGTVEKDVRAGDSLYAMVGMGANDNPPTQITDSKSQTWVQAGSLTNSGSGLSWWLYECRNSVALASTGTPDTITAHFGATTHGKDLIVVGCSGMNLTSDVDQIAGSYGYGDTPAVAIPKPLSNSNELLIGAVVGGSKAGDVTWPSGWTELAQVLTASGGIYLSVAVKTVYSTAAPKYQAGMAGTTTWAAMLAALLPAAASGPSSVVQITEGSPLNPMTAGQPFAEQLHAVGGDPPYMWDVTAGALPAGVSLTAGTTGGGGGTSPSILHVGAVAGPDNQVGQALSYLDQAQAAIGPGLTMTKIFYSGDLPSDWTVRASASSFAQGISPAEIVSKYPDMIVVVCWNGPGGGQPSTPSTIAKFASSIPPGVTLAFCWQQEPEGSGSGLTGKQFRDGFHAIAVALHALGRTQYDADGIPSGLITCTAHTWGQYMPGGKAVDGSYLPPAADCDVYGFDIYQHEQGGSYNGATTWPSQGLANHAGFQKWLQLVVPLARPLGRPLMLCEYGVDSNASGTGETAAGDDKRNSRIQADYAYLTAAFGDGGTAYTQPLFGWIYWWRLMGANNTDYKFTDAATKSTWRAIAAGGASSGSSSTGGLVSGTPTAAGSGSVTIRATDASAHSVSKAFAWTVAGPPALAFTTDATLPGADAGQPYTLVFHASGGQDTYTFAVHAGDSLPTGLTLSPDGVLSGTPASPGSAAFSVDVTDSALTTVTKAFTLLIKPAVQVATTSLPAATAGAAYSETLGTQGGTSPFQWTLTAGPLPPGLVMDGDTGTISGTPTQPGVYPITVQVSDAAGGSASADLILTVSQVTGGLPAIGRRRFGGTMADWTMTFVGDQVDRAANVVVIFFDAADGGTQLTDLKAVNGASISSVITDSNGEMPEFFGPPGVMELWADANGGLGPRRRMIAADLADLVAQMYSVLSTVAG